MKISIINYGLGNLGSVANMCRYLGYSPIITNDYSDILSSDKIILPGVGNFDQGVKNINSFGLINPILSFVHELQRPLLGICLGAQILGKSSEEGILPGLSIVNINSRRFPSSEVYRVPHMRWNSISAFNKISILSDLNSFNRFYFTHSYYMSCSDDNCNLAMSNYILPFIAAYQFGSVFGVQFHPEKSHKFGFQVLSNFLRAS